MKTMKDVPVWAKILVWTPLGLYIYPKYYFGTYVPTWFAIINGCLGGFYVTQMIDLIIKYLT